ncbi:chromosome segregation protein SMC [Vagococcus penaei]|uniref:Chromosome partition protein Smc n=1 Tax=Vagococcus penaei TaxID=633807 RepID=A0A1Q2D6N1_9ENTE|nr:chromosome segregation protein SMC [Vagococcus penaei]AQP54079.1 chromosome segregation protein SMC [Vagococcus penaei]RST98487.1 chromosome segregation protein SMC [Vagococcus penaei]
MHLKRLEIAGFKSFADRTVIEFNHGLTAVVGPNGSGKSNITEAIRWVLGEQSAKNLRGGKMPDVIFAGSSSRSPLNVAEVTVVLDNTEQTLPIDYNEVSVTRRLTRSGESDFFINKQACRLKDIVNLFMDSGLGRESFSIISQGKVEAIFNSKPEERRGVFEEAAGVLKYKTRKKEAERKLVETDDNLSRVTDIIFELESQKDTLAEQSERAKKFLLLKEELKEIDSQVTVEQMARMKEAYDDKTSELEMIQTVVVTEQQQISQIEEQLSHARDKRDQLDVLLQTLQSELLTVTQTYEQIEGQKNVLEERQKYSEQSAGQYQQALLTLQQVIRETQEDILAIQAEKQQLQVEKKSLTTTIAELTQMEKVLSQSSKEQLADLRGDYVDVMQQQTNINNDLKHLEKQYEQETRRNKKDLDRYEELLTLENDAKARQEVLKTSQINHQTYLEKLLVTFQQEQANYQALKEAVQTNERQMYDALKILQQAQAKEKSLKDLQENYAGYYQGVRSVLKEKQQLPGIIGAVAELITVPNEFSLAIETALGAAAQHIVVSDEASARQGITFLKQKRAGRATFLPLTTIKSRIMPETSRQQAQKISGFIGVASELVTYESTVQSIIQNVLGVTIIAKDLASANALAQALSYKYRVVSLEGDVMNPGGSMTGGATKKGQSSNLFNQTNDLQTLAQQISQMRDMYQRKEQDVLTKKAALQALEQTLDKLRQDGEEARLQEQSFVNEVQKVEQMILQYSKERRAFEYEKQELQRFLVLYQEEKEQLEEARIELQKKRELLDQLMNQTDQQAEDNSRKRDDVKSQLATKQSELAVMTERMTHLSTRYKEKTAQLTELESELARSQEQLKSESGEQLTHSERNQLLEEKMIQLRQQREEIMVRLEETRASREAIHQTITIHDQELGRKNKVLQQETDRKIAIEVARKQADITLDRLTTYLTEEYQTNYDSVKDTLGPVVDFEQGKKRINELKQMLKMLGTVNLQAIDDYNELLERYQFLVSQRDDLLNAKEALYTTMSEMDQLVIEKFHDVFSDIRHEFQQVFPNMFGGGHADLTLTDPTDLLNTGIDIVAQPPGKKLQQLSLLSGGERALTAIALLFAIIQARPVPFCILDEVEAALDDANVTRYGNYLRNFGDNRQFIVITHRKGTMEAADILYGVAMQESGVSKIVSVHMEDFTIDSHEN